MTEANRSMDDLPALLEERRKYEAWLTALDARRDAASKHVFDKVRMDYEGRLRHVQAELAAHRHAIQEERASLSSRVALLEADEQLRRDERAELELRLHVGEIQGEAADSAFRTVDESLEHIVGEKNDLAKRIDNLDMLLAPSAAEMRSASADGGDTQPASENVASLLAETTPVSMDPISEPTNDPLTQPAGESGGELPIESPGERSNEPASAAEVATSSHAGPQVDAPGIDRDPRHTPGGTFDELAFLSDLVGDGTRASKPVARDDGGTESLLAGLDDATQRRGGERPLGSNVPGHTPIAIRVSGAIEQVKTLKCTECGAMNYPTEWYCERCGAELAAL
jgi:hypothetical protein